MAKRRIHLTESQLYGLVEQTLNELDWRTKAQLANARSLQASNALLHDASPEEEKYWNKVWPERDLSWLNASAAVNKDVGKDTYGYDPHKSFWGDPRGVFYKKGEKWGAPSYEGYDDDYYSNYGFDEDFMKQVGPYLRQESYYDNTLKRWLDPDDEGYNKERNAEFWRQEKLKRPNKDDDERYKRVMRSGQKNESLARRVTESVIRKLREDADMDGDQFEDLLRYAYKRILEILFIAEEFSKRKANKICQVTINNMTRAKALLEALGAYKNVSLEGLGSPTFEADSDNLLFYLAEKAFSSALSYIEDAIELAPMEDGENEDNSTTHQILYKIRDILEYVAQKW